MELAKKLSRTEQNNEPRTKVSWDLYLNGASEKVIKEKADHIGAMVAQDVLKSLPVFQMDEPSTTTPRELNVSPETDLGQSPAHVSHTPKQRKAKSQIWEDKKDSTPSKLLRKTKSAPLQTLSPNVTRANTNTPPKKAVRFRDEFSPSPARFVSVNEAILDKENMSPFEVMSPKGSPFGMSPKTSLSKFDINATIEEIDQTLSESYVQFSELQDVVNESALETGQQDESLLEQLEHIKQEQEKLKKLQLSLQKKLIKQESSKPHTPESRLVRKQHSSRKKKCTKSPLAKKHVEIVNENVENNSSENKMHVIDADGELPPSPVGDQVKETIISAQNQLETPVRQLQPTSLFSVPAEKENQFEKDLNVNLNPADTTSLQLATPLNNLRKIQSDIGHCFLDTPTGGILRTPVSHRMANNFSDSVTSTLKPTPIRRSQSGTIMSVAGNRPLMDGSISMVTTPISSPCHLYTSTETGSHQVH